MNLRPHNPRAANATGVDARRLIGCGIALLGLTTGLTMLSGCESGAGDPSGGSPAPAPPEVGVIEVQPERVELTTELPGRVSVVRAAEVRPQVSGIITELLFTQGARVDAGQILYRLDSRPFRAAVAAAEAEVARAEAARHSAGLREQRLKRLLADNAISRQEYDDAEAALLQREAEVLAAEAALDVARIDLEYTDIRAPIDGVVGPTRVTTGGLMTANQTAAMTQITELDPIYVDIQQPAGELPGLRRELGSGADRGVDLRLEDGSMYPHTGALEVSDVVVNPGTGSVTLRSRFANPDGVLLPGMFVRTRLITGIRDQAIVVPQQAIQRTPRGQAQAFVVNADGTAEARTVEISRAIGNRWLINAGIAAGDRLIVTGTQRFGPGDRVKPVAWTPDSSAESNDG